MNSSFRVTERSLATTTLHGLQNSLARLGATQQQLSSGKQISRPSDSPTGTIAAIGIRSDMRQLQQYARNADDGKGWLDTVDGTLTDASAMVHQARNLVLQGLSSGAVGPAARDALAIEVDRLRESLIGLANTTYLDRPIFGGTTPGAIAYDASGSYVGDAGSVRRTVGEGVKVRVDTPASATFGTGSTQLFTVLADISAHLRGDSASLGADLGRLDTAMDRVHAQLADVGARYNVVAQLGQAASDRTTELQAALSDVEDIDLPKTITEFQLGQAAYQAALGATARVVQSSLLDFLR